MRINGLFSKVRSFGQDDWFGFAGCAPFPDGGQPRCVEFKVRDGDGIWDAILVVCGEAVQIHWVVEYRCSLCAQGATESRWVDLVPFGYFSHLRDEIHPSPELAYLLAFQIDGLMDRLESGERYVYADKLRRLGFSAVERG